MKRTWPFLLGLVVLAALAAQAQFTCATNADGTLTITGYTGSGGALTIPSTIDGPRVTGIGDNAFESANLSSVTVPGGAITVAPPNTTKLTLTINKTTGAVSGSFANPSSPEQTIKLNGVLLQSQTNAVGHFLGANQSGASLLENQ